MGLVAAAAFLHPFGATAGIGLSNSAHTAAFTGFRLAARDSGGFRPKIVEVTTDAVRVPVSSVQASAE